MANRSAMYRLLGSASWQRTVGELPSWQLTGLTPGIYEVDIGDGEILQVPVTSSASNPQLFDLTGVFTLPENSAQGTLAGLIQGKTGGSTLSLLDNAGGRVQLNGLRIENGTTGLDYETGTSHSFTVRETLGSATNDTVFTLTVTAAVGVPTVAEPSNWALSWHEDFPPVSSDGQSVTVLGSDGVGAFVAMKAERDTGRYIGKQTYTPLTSRIDDHNAFSEIKLTSGVALRGQCGHASRYQTGAVGNEIRVYRSLDGTFEGFPTDRSQAVIIPLAAGSAPNYLQFHQLPSGRVIFMYVEDSSNSARFVISDDDGTSWYTGRKVFTTSLDQIYFRIDPAGIYTGTIGAVTSTFLPIYVFVNVAYDQAPLRFVWMDEATGLFYSPVTGARIGSTTDSAYGTGSSAIITLGASASDACPNVRVPAAGRTQRTNNVYKNVAYITDTKAKSDADPFGGARHLVVVRSGTGATVAEYSIGLAGKPFWSNGYMPDMQPALEPHTGFRAYCCRNDGTAYNSGSKLVRVDYPNGLAAGDARELVMLEAGVTPGIDATDAICRFFPVKGAQATGVIGFAWVVDSYTTYTDWSGGRFVPVMASSETGAPVQPLPGTPTISFASPAFSQNEGTSNSTITNTINVVRNGVTGALTVNLTYGGTATSGTDYQAGPATITIPSGANSASFDLTVIGDTAVEPDETIVINAALAGYSATASKTITLTNDDAPASGRTLFYEDTFTSSTGAAKNASTHTSDSGATYTAQTGSLSVGATGSTYSLTSPFLYLISTVMPDTGNFDIEEVVDSRTTAASGIAVVFNSDGANSPTALAVAVSVTGAITLQKLNSASATTSLATYEQGTIADNDLYLIRGRLAGGVKTVEVLLNGTQIIPPTVITDGPTGNRMQLRNGGNSPNTATTGIGWDSIRAYTVSI